MTDQIATPAPLRPFTVRVELPVQWGEMDAYGHVNNAMFFRYYESARIAYLDACGFLTAYDEHRVGAILHSTSCRFRRPLEYPDRCIVGARVTAIHDDRFEHEYLVYSTAQDAVAGTGTGIVVAFDYVRRRKTSLPAAVRRGIDDLDGIR